MRSRTSNTRALSQRKRTWLKREATEKEERKLDSLASLQGVYGTKNTDEARAGKFENRTQMPKALPFFVCSPAENELEFGNSLIFRIAMPFLSPKQLGKVYRQIATIKPRLLGVDVGTMNVGIALSDPSLRMAIPLTTLNRRDCSCILHP